MHRAIKIATIAFLVVEIAWGVLLLYGTSDGAWSVVDYLAFVYGGIGFCVFGAIWLVIAWVRAHRRSSRRGPWRFVTASVLVQPVLLGIVLITSSTGLSFRARFALSKPSLERYATSLAEGRVATQVPGWIGLLHIKEVDRARDSVRFITGECFFDDCGVAYSPLHEPPRVGEDIYREMSGSWWYWRRSW